MSYGNKTLIGYRKTHKTNKESNNGGYAMLRYVSTFLKLVIREENIETYSFSIQINKHFPSVFFTFGKSLYNFMK